MSETEDFDKLGNKAITKRRLSEARELLEDALEDALARMPVGWQAVQEDATSLQIAFWDQEEFLA